MKPLIGRTQLFTSLEPVEENIPEILENIMGIHNENANEIDYLYRYYKGDQPILDRVKDIRPEITNKIVENHAYEIVEFKTGYTFGEPIQYVSKGKDSEDDREDMIETESITKLNELMDLDDKASKDRELGEWMFICGTGYRMVLPSDDEFLPFETEILDPRNTFVVYSTGFGKKPVLSGTFVKKIEGKDEKIYIGLYSKDKYFKVETEPGLSEYAVLESIPHSLNGLPIIEYPLNPSRLGVFEPVLGLLDTLNNISSNRMDGIEQFVQSIMKFINCDIDKETFKELLDLGALKVQSSEGRDADVEIMTAELDQQQSQTYVDYIYQTVLTITGVPDRRASAGGNTGQALIVGQGWTNAESRAIATELMFNKSEKRFLRVIMNILDALSYDENLKLSNIDIKFTRNKTDNLLVKTQGLQNMLEAGIHPRTAISTSGLFSDPEQVFVDSTQYLQKWKEDKGEENKNQKPNPPDIY